MSYNYFVEFTIWSKFENDKKLCHLHQKTIESWKPDIPDLETNWKYEGRFFALSIVYRGILSRGYEIINYSQNKRYPYQLLLTETYGIDERQFFEGSIPNEFDFDLFHGSFITLAGIYENQFPNIKTVPLMLIEDGQNLLIEMVKDFKKENKKWYDIKQISRYYVTNVFESDPSQFHFWRANSEKICLPTTAEQKEYNTILECVMDNSKNVLKNKEIYVETTSDQIYDIYQQTSNVSSNGQIPIIQGFIVLFALLIVVVLLFYYFRLTFQ
jgi:hypothetical protein